MITTKLSHLKKNTDAMIIIKKKLENKNVLSKDSKILEEQLLNLEKDILVLKNKVDNKNERIIFFIYFLYIADFI